MPRPRYEFDLAVCTAIISACTLAVLYLTRPAGEMSNARSSGIMFAAFFTLFCVGYAFLGHRTYRKYLDIRDGHGIVARWTVSSDEWKHFVRTESARIRKSDELHNLLEYKRIPAEHEVEIVIARTGVIVGNDFHRLDKLATIAYPPMLIDTDPATVEIRVENEAGRDPDTHTIMNHVLRFPVSRNHMDSVRQLIQEYAGHSTKPRPRTVPLDDT